MNLASIFSDIASSIRTKTFSDTALKPNEMAPAINNISSVRDNLYANAVCWNNNGAMETYSDFVCSISDNTFNQVPIIPDGKDNLINAFKDCEEFNQPVNIPDSVTSMWGAFINCYNFDQPIDIPNGVTNVARLLWRCNNFNSPVNFPDTVTNMHDVFSGCTNFNLPVTIPNHVTNMYGAFFNCTSLSNQTIVIPDTVVDMVDMMRSGYQADNSLVFINGTLIFPNANPNLNCVGLFAQYAYTGRPFSGTRYIICTPDKTNLFLNTTNSIVAYGVNVSWQTMTNGYFNKMYNVYIYNNYGL